MLKVNLQPWQAILGIFLILPAFWVQTGMIYCNCGDLPAATCGCPASPYIFKLLPLPFAIPYYFKYANEESWLWILVGLVVCALIYFLVVKFFSRRFSAGKSSN